MASSTSLSSTTTTPIRKSKNKCGIIMLHEWWLVKKEKGGIGVGGIASMGMREERESVFISTSILKRYEANVVETEDGITLILRGFINASRSSLNGFPSHISQHFLLGFPFHWIQFTNNQSNNIQKKKKKKKNKKSLPTTTTTTTPQLPLRRSPRLRHQIIKDHSF